MYIYNASKFIIKRVCPASLSFYKGGVRMSKKYIFLNRNDIYAIYYRCINTVYYNLRFKNKTQIIILN
nr:MAG TPA: hypothetical protein [Caudoviricetes sp.]